LSTGALIVGAGQAGAQIAISLREIGYREPITLIGEEPYAPYQRPPLSKSVLLGDRDVLELHIKGPNYFAEKSIRVITGERVESIEVDTDGVGGRASTSSGQVIEFEKLALATGAGARRLDVEGADLDGVHCLRGIDDAVTLRDRLRADQRIVVVGGGFIGLEFAAAARSRGADVTVLQSTDRLLSRAVGPAISDFYLDAHTRRGVTVLLESDLVAIHGDPHSRAVNAVELADGTRLAADLVVVGIGAKPNVELAEHLGLECDGGIVVDAQARTSRTQIVAAGDCTVSLDPLTETRVRLESVQNAVNQGRCAAASLAGSMGIKPAVPYFWSDQYDLTLQIAGLSQGYDKVVIRGDRGSEQFAALYYRGSRLIAIDAVNCPRDYAAVLSALRSGAHIPAELAVQGALSLRDMMKAPIPAER